MNFSRGAIVEPEESKKEESMVVEDIESLKKALEEEKAKGERYLNNWQRAEADFQNYRKRLEQEREEVNKFAKKMLILKLLPILDDFERAFSTLSPRLAGWSWVDGMRIIYRKLQAVLETEGVSEIKALGEKFDPAIHEAVIHTEGEEGKVIEEVQKGYRLHERIIRPALVVVGKGEKKEEV